ncbi:uncharacterized protein LOC131890933 [Tigriopus californicus]|uniref:uncharacterized protein LOC131890933 n=1 Tax=Tigriopus californicus TaxID=6832 RepID=UPI0027DAAE9A|nr:uncharacterized protein LOC131890933 [Tigriopus californicus]
MPFFHHFLSESLANNQQCCQTTNMSQPTAISQQRPNNNGMIKQLKCGYLLHYKKKLFGKAWREEFVVLYEDSSVIWFRDRDRLDPEGGVFLRDAPELLAAGQWVSRVPVKPELPSGCDIKLAIAMGSRHRDKIQWFLCKSEAELVEWMSAINKTLPQPPPPPEEMRTLSRSTGSKGKEMLPTATHEDLPPFILPPPPPPPQLVLTSTGCRDCDADKLAQRFDRMALNNATNNGRSATQGFTDHTRSFSAGRLNAIKRDGSGSNGTSTPKLLPKPMTRQLSFQDNDTCSPNRSKGSFTNVAAGVLIGGVLTQWNTGPDCWDWGMGWGWTGWNAAFCGTCAMEQAVLANHGILQPHLTTAPPTTGIQGSHPGDSNAAHFYFDGDQDIGELGETDVDCDFGDFGF